MEWHAPGGVIHGSIDASDSHMTIVQKLISSKLLSMRETASANDEETIAAALAKLVGARKLLLAGVGASSLVAKDFSYKLLKLGRTVLLNSDNHKWYLNKMDPEEAKARQERQEEFKERYEKD